jgi:hypothetical protein
MTLIEHKIENHSMNAEDSKALRIDKFRKWKHSIAYSTWHVYSSRYISLCGD